MELNRIPTVPVPNSPSKNTSATQPDRSAHFQTQLNLPEYPPLAYTSVEPNSASHFEDSNPKKSKPLIGSEEWTNARRLSHREVERKRREKINSGINELATLIPNGEKNKGKVLRRAAEYIRYLKEQEQISVERWTLEKLRRDQA